MEIPITGTIAVLLAIIALQRRTFLLAALIMSSPLSATAVLNFPENQKALTFPVFFSIVYVLASLLRVRMVQWVVQDVRFWLAGVFVTTLLASFLLSPAWGMTPKDFLTPPETPQLAYIILGILTAFFVAQDVRHNNLGIDASRYASYAVLIICLIGLLQLTCHLIGIDYPEWFFNNSVNPTNQGHTAVLDNDLKRISSASSEPSILALFLSSMLAMLLYAKPHIPRRTANLAIILSLIVLLLSTSATAYLGLILILFFIVATWTRKMLDRVLITYFLLAGILTASYIAWPLIEIKLGTYSAWERFASITEGWAAFMNYPALGHGWGTVTVNSLPVGILANTGLLGSSTFLLWVLYVLYESVIALRLRRHDSPTKGYLAAFFVVMALQTVTGFAYVYSFFWIIFGLLMGYVHSTRPLFQEVEASRCV